MGPILMDARNSLTFSLSALILLPWLFRRSHAFMTFMRLDCEHFMPKTVWYQKMCYASALDATHCL